MGKTRKIKRREVLGRERVIGGMWGRGSGGGRRNSGSKASEGAAAEEGPRRRRGSAGELPGGRSEPRGSPGRRQTLCGDVTPELETMINMIICIKSEWVLFSGRMPRMMNGPGSQIDG